MIVKLRDSLTAKIFLITCFLLTSVCILTYGLIARLMPLTYTVDRENLLKSQGDWLAAQLTECTLDNSAPLLSQFSFQYDVQVSIEDSLGNVVGGTDISSIMRTEESGLQETVMTQPEVNLSIPSGEKEDYSVYCIAYEFSFQDSTEIYKLYVLGSTRAVNQATEALGRIWPWLTAAILLVSVLSSVFYARFITRPIVRISSISQKLSELDFSWRCGEQRTDEIGTLAHSLDTLADRLSRSMEELQTANAALQEDIERELQLEQAQLDFFSAVSHELKTPITIIKGQLGGMLDGVGVYADRDKYLAHSLIVVQQMENLVQELLAISRMEKGGEPSLVPVELTSFVSECLRDYNELFRQKGQQVVVNLSSEEWIKGEAPLLKKAIGNLLSNAALYSPDNASIYVTVQEAGSSVMFTVENEGTHISSQALPHLFEAFFRGDPSRSRQTGGSGLGLYLVQKIAVRHGGFCQIHNSKKGVVAILSVPKSTQTPQ